MVVATLFPIRTYFRVFIDCLYHYKIGCLQFPPKRAKNENVLYAKQFSYGNSFCMSWRRIIMASLEVDESAIQINLCSVLNRVRSAFDSTPIEKRASSAIRLVAVSKTKPVEAILAAYHIGQRHFGENYVQELIAKANDPRIVSECSDIRWHFIGHLQSNKISKVVHSVPNLYLIETVESEKCAQKLDAAIKEKSSDEDGLRVMVEVNTSGESQKSGISPDEAMELATYIKESCSSLRFIGFMTIGLFERTGETNPDFECLVETRKTYCQRHNIADEKSIELSMGMSADFELAITMGATNVRVGSTIFGTREQMKKKE